MAVYVRNSTDEVVSVAIGFRDDSCGTKVKVPWRKAGWWNVNPGESRRILRGDSDGRHYFLFAESKSFVWDGPYGTDIPKGGGPFSWCWDLACNFCRIVGFRRTPRTGSVKAENYTINLTPPRKGNASRKNYTINLTPSRILGEGKAKLGQNRRTLPKKQKVIKAKLGRNRMIRYK